ELPSVFAPDVVAVQAAADHPDGHAHGVTHGLVVEFVAPVLPRGGDPPGEFLGGAVVELGGDLLQDAPRSSLADLERDRLRQAPVELHGLRRHFGARAGLPGRGSPLRLSLGLHGPWAGLAYTRAVVRLITYGRYR